MVFLILTFYLIFFAGFADIGKAEGLSGTVSAKYMCRRYDIGADIVSANIGNIGGSAVSGTALQYHIKFETPGSITLHSFSLCRGRINIILKMKVEASQSSRLFARPIINGAVLIKLGGWSFQRVLRRSGCICRKLSSELSI